MKNADFGIAFHTIYKAGGNGEKVQSFNVDPKRIDAPDNFYIMSPAISASNNKDDYNVDNLESTYEGLKTAEQALINDPAYEDLINNQAFMSYWNTFENSNLADKKQANLNVSTLIKDLKSYVKDKQDKEYTKKLDKLKTDKGRQSATDKYNKDVQELSDLIENNTKTILNLVNTLNLAANIKMMMWQGLKNAKNNYSTFYKSRTKGYFPAEGEGIAMSDQDGNIVKIVDRTSFSSYNRDPDIMSGFEHNIDEDLFYNKRWDEISSDDAKELIKKRRIRASTKFFGLRYFINFYQDYGYYELYAYDMFGKKRISIKFDSNDYGFEDIEALYNKLINMRNINMLLKDHTDQYDLNRNESLDMINSVFNINEDLEKTAVVAFGRMNPPTIGHNKLIDKMASLNGEPKLYLSHSQNDKKDPLPYESKIKWCKKAFGDRVDVVESAARNAFEVLHDLYEEGYTDIIYVGGEDRIGGEGDISASIKKYNGVPDKKGNIIYDFNSITFENAGARNPDSNDPEEQASASLARKLVLENNFNEFKKYVPFDTNSAFALYRELRKAMTGKEESFMRECDIRIEELRNNMKVRKHINEDDESNFKKTRDLSKAKSLDNAYGILRQELKSSGADESTMSQFDSAVKDIENITNTLSVDILNKLSKRLSDCHAGLTSTQFIKYFDPSQSDLNILLKDNELKIGVNDLSALKLEKEFLNKLISFKGGDKNSTTAIGEYEFLIAVLFKGGSMVTSNKGGDVSVNNLDVEVKKIKSPAAIGYDIGDAANLTKAYDDFIYDNFEDHNRGTKTRATIRPESLNVQIEKSSLPDIIKKVVGGSGKISFSDLYKSVFKKLINMYSNRFKLLALCKGYNITIIESNNNLADVLLANYRVTFADYVGKRVFKIQG